MKKNLLKLAAVVAVAFVAGACLTACGHDDDLPVPPGKKEQKEQTPESKPDKNPAPKPGPESSDGIVKAVLTVHDGHLHGTYNFHQNTHAKEVKYLAVDQKFVYHHRDGHWMADESNPKSLAVISGSSAAYALTIDYYDADGHLINGRFIDNGADKKHQHFFLADEVKKGFGNSSSFKYDGSPSSLYRYVYCDTAPWDKSNKYDGAEFIGGENPLGFKGYFKFRESRITFNLVIKLMEARESKFDGEDASPYDAPSAKQLSEAKWFDAIVLPVNVFMASNENLFDFNPTLEKKESDYSAKEHLIIESLAKALGVSFLEAARDFYFQQNGEAIHNENGFWF